MSAAKPRVSIGLPVYNGERYLRQAIDSILAQTFTDFELIISDNASTDATAEIGQTYAAQDARVRYHRNAVNLGAARNYNRLVELAAGEYFKWASHDDLIASEYLERCLAVLDRQPAAVLCYPQACFIDADGQFLAADPFGLELRAPRPRERYAAYHQRFRHSRKCNAVFGVMRTAILRRTAMIGNYVASDEVLLGELALHGEIVEVPETLFFRRDHPGSSVRAYRIEDRLAWFDPARQGQLNLPTWAWLNGQIGAVRRAPLPPLERLACAQTLGRWGWRNKRRLYNEGLLALKTWARPLPAFIRRPVRLVLRQGWRLVRGTFDRLRNGPAPRHH